MKTKANPKRRKSATTKARTSNRQLPKATQPKRKAPRNVTCDTPVNFPIPSGGEANVSGQTHNPDALTDPQSNVASDSVLLADIAKCVEMAESAPTSTILQPCPAISNDISHPAEFVCVVFVGVECQVFGMSSRRKYRGRAADLVENVEAMQARLESRADEVWNAFLSLKAKIAFNSSRRPALFSRDLQK